MADDPVLPTVAYRPDEVARLLGTLLENRVTDYKGRFLHALVARVAAGERVIPLRELALDMLVKALEAKIDPTAGSLLARLLSRLATVPPGPDARAVVRSRVSDADLDDLVAYVPYRALSGFFRDALRKVPDRRKNAAVVRLADQAYATARPPCYRFVLTRTGPAIEVHPYWHDILRSQASHLQDHAIAAVVGDSARLSVVGGYSRGLRGENRLFSAVRSDGAILPPSVLLRVHREDPNLGGLTPDDYGLSGVKVREEASRAWSALQGAWRAFQAERARLPEGDAGTGLTRRRWLNQVLKVLGYGALEPLGSSLRVGDREYPISHRYKHVPIHLVGCGLDLDRRTKGAAGAATASPHGLVQLYLNEEPAALWGFVSNGLRWRILRDSKSLSRLAMVEFDLEAIFEGELYDEFLLFFLVCHHSRVQADRPEETWLERWSQAAGEAGKRALDSLRNGVEKAIEAIGQGFLRHPENGALREKLRSGRLDRQEYYRQLLRVVYRLLFLFVAEDRGLVPHPDAPEAARRLYADGYGTQRLRALALRARGGRRHHDAYEAFAVLVRLLGRPEGCPELGLSPLGGFLFSDEACPDLDGAKLPNDAFFAAVERLAYTEEDGRLARVDFKNLATEEMGSVYESLLELHPELNADGTEFALCSAAGNERKSTGSYYTPDSLVQCLLDSALEPVVDDTLKRAGRDPEARERAILDLRVVDPAVGSGHFLIAAAHRLARRLAQIRTGDDEPGPEAVRRALRDVVGRCLYGVDVNPMAVELCKVALWLEALEPGRPLGFLDHHIVVGNSVIGATPELIARGIPDGAYTAVEGDDKEVCKLLKKRNKQEREGQGNLFAPESFVGGDLLAAWRELEAAGDDDLAAVQRKAERLRRAEAAVAMRKAVADVWCAAFFLTKTPDALKDPGRPLAVTTATLRRLMAGETIPADLEAAIRAEAERVRFFHWHLAFPDVFANGGFDVLLISPAFERFVRKLRHPREKSLQASCYRNSEITSALLLRFSKPS